MREKLPDRRRNWTQTVRIGGQTFHMTVGEYNDGRPGEVFLNVNKQGTFTCGILDSLARNISLSLQNGTSLEDIAKVNQLLNFPPNGEVTGSKNVTQATSAVDWISQELYATYCSGKAPEPMKEEKSAGYISESWRTGV